MGGQRYWKDGRDVYDLIMGLMDYPETDSASRLHPGPSVQLRGWRRRRHFLPIHGQRRRDQRQLHAAHPQPDRDCPAESQRRAQGVQLGHHVLEVDAGGVGRKTAARSPRSKPASGRTWPEKFTVPEGYDERLGHFVHFFTAIREKKPVYENATFGFRAAAPALLCNDSLRLGRLMSWDPAQMKVVS